MKTHLIFLLVFLLTACGNDDSFMPGLKTYAAADIYGVISEDGMNYTQGELIGNAAIEFQDSVLTMVVSLSGMEPNTSHAMHLHQGTLQQPKHHWNRGEFVAFCNERSLGQVWAKLFAGDVGNIDIDNDGNGIFTIKTDLWTIGTEDVRDISGTVLFIHHMSEDFVAECDPNHEHQHGHTNAKIAGGKIVFGAQILN